MIHCPECGCLVEDDIASQMGGSDDIVIPPPAPEAGILNDSTAGSAAPPIPPAVVPTPPQPVEEVPLPQQPPSISPPPPVTPGSARVTPAEDWGAKNGLMPPPISTPAKVAAASASGGKCQRCGCAAGTAICEVCAALPEPALVLEVEGFEPVIYRGRKVFRVAVLADVVTVGRRDPATQTYPDIDLREFHANNVGFTGRRQAEIIYDGGKYHVSDRGGRETTQYAPDAAASWQIVPLNERCELKVGSRIMFGEAVSLHVLDPKNL